MFFSGGVLVCCYKWVLQLQKLPIISRFERLSIRLQHNSRSANKFSQREVQDEITFSDSRIVSDTNSVKIGQNRFDLIRKKTKYKGAKSLNCLECFWHFVWNDDLIDCAVLTSVISLSRKNVLHSGETVLVRLLGLRSYMSRTLGLLTLKWVSSFKKWWNHELKRKMKRFFFTSFFSSRSVNQPQ